MISQLTEFVRQIPPFVKEMAIEPKTGLHIKVKIHNDRYEVVGHERYLGKKHGELSDFLKDCASLQNNSWMIDTNKCFDLPAKGIHSASPYCLAFKRESWIGGDKYSSNKPDVVSRLEGYFNKCFDQKFELSEKEKARGIQFKDFLKTKLNRLLGELLEREPLEQSDYIVIYNHSNFEEYQSFNIKYLTGGLFNTAEFNVEVDDITLGTSNFYNGFNSKKPFLTHQTASFDITGRITALEAKELSEFSLLIGKKLFPNPLPLFIDDRELTNCSIEVFHREGNKRATHREIITALLRKRETLGNYYLLYFSGGAIQDFDFVAKFQYELSSLNDPEWAIENIMEIRNKDKEILPAERLLNVFDFERVVVREVFNNTLVKVDEKNDEASFRYFDEIDAKYYRPALYALLLKYRKPIYDYIYKSMRSGIQAHQFHDICMTMIMDELKQDGKEFSIRKKLNIYFSIHQYFARNINHSIMPSKIEEHKTQLRIIIDNEDTHFNTDETYAFGAGQLIYYLLSQSESGERTHALLEPFLQKTNYAHFNEAISNAILKYKHALSFDYKRFNKLVGEVLDYKTEKQLQELRPTILAGYFCPNIFYASTKK